MSFETVNYVLNGTVATITMNRPDSLNSLSLQLGKDLRAAVERAASEGVRAIVLTGAGRAFCAGGDLKEMQEMGNAEGRIEAFLDSPLKSLHDLIRTIRETPIPFIAAVNGVCAGAGVNLALACDIVLASDDAAFREAFVRIGLTPDCGGTFFLPRAIGEKLATEMFMTGDSLSAERALQIGMINNVVPSANLMSESAKLAVKLAMGPTAAMGRIKKMMNATFSNDLNEQLALEAECQLESGRSADFKEGVAAFFDKRPPAFTGK